MSPEVPRAEARPAEPRERFAQLLDGYLAAQLLYVAAELRLADALTERTATSDELAETVGAEPGLLRRVLRGLAAERVVDELDDGRFALTEVGQLLREGVPGSLHGQALVRGLYYSSFAGLVPAVRGGGTPFDLAHDRTFFEYLAAHPEQYAHFQSTMTARSTREAEAVVQVVDFRRFGTVVDVGGGWGALLSAVLAAAPGVAGTLFDRPEVVAGADLPAVGGDFFVEIPAGAAAYLLSRVIHDWDDAEAVAILRTCRRAMTPSATLLLVEAVLPERAVDHPAVVRMDLLMLVALHGRERTVAEYAGLLKAAGLLLVDAISADEATGLHVLTARRAD